MIASIQHNTHVTHIVDAYLARIVAITRVAGGSITMLAYLKAERNLWSQIISNPYGGMAAGLIGGAYVMFVDTIDELSKVDEQTGRTHVNIAQSGLEDVAVQIIIRAEPSLNAVAVRTEVNAELLRLHGA